jgi:FdhE protein
MPRTTTRLRSDTGSRLADLERQRPEWQSWIAMLGVAERALTDESWHPPLTETAVDLRLSSAAADEPILHGQVLQIGVNRLQRLVRELASTAKSLRGYQPSEADTLELISAAVRQQGYEIERLAADSGVGAAALATVAQLAAVPLLQSCGQLLERRVPRSWQHGYCPICAAWPIIAERRGLDRSRRLRCGRCTAEWEVEWLCCIYCGEREHKRLGSLDPDERRETLKIETCETCHGYLKSIATLQGFPAFELLLQDLETVELDLVALDRGYCRPTDSGFALDVKLVSDATRRAL